MTKRGLFVTFEGVGPTIFDSQVAMHAREMKKHGVDFEIWSFETWPGLFQQSEARLAHAQELAQSQIQLFRGVFVYLPLSEILNAFLLLYQLIRTRADFQFIHARGDYAASVCGYVARWRRIPVVWDCRGDAAAEFGSAYRPRTPLGRAVKWVNLRLIRWRTYHAGRTCAQAIFVSDLLRRRKGRSLEHKPVEVIPSSVSSQLFYVSMELREMTRARLGFSDEDRVLLYSGGMTGYQGFSEYVHLYQTLYEGDARFRFLVVTPHLDRAARALAQLPEATYRLRSASFEEMNAFYNAADFGALLREHNAVNDVASPTKFGEYCLCGLPVIMNDSVQQSFQFAQELGNLIAYGRRLSPQELVMRSEVERKETSGKAARLLSREYLAQRYLRIYLRT